MANEQELNKIQQKLEDIELALNESSIVAITDNRGIIQFANDKFCELSKYTKDELIGNKHSIINSCHHGREFFKEMWRTIGKGEVWKGEIKNLAKDGTYYWVDTTIVPFLKKNGKPYQYVAIRHDITKRKEYEETIKRMAYYDPLTTLPNRNYLNKWLDEKWKNNEVVNTILFMDIDRFKSINDNFGHSIGDQVLKDAGSRIQACICNDDLIVRAGGDEFIVFLDGVRNKQDVNNVIRRIQEQFKSPFYTHNIKLYTSISIGISKVMIDENNRYNDKKIEESIIHADRAMYHAKKQGGNTYCFNTPHQNIEIERYYILEQELKRALAQKQFTIVYQPLVNLATNQVVGTEALLRWSHPQIGSVKPSEFIPLLEELDLITPVGNWVLRSVCQQLKNWHRKGIYIQRASVNVSPKQINHSNFVDDLKDILYETELEAKYLELEITEGTLINITETNIKLNKLKELGIKISIDDFGTGYSSLNYLNKLPINTLKIDKSFINELGSDTEIIVNTIITLGKNLQFKVLAEGIEKEEQLTYLKKHACNEGQGYYWSKPVNNEALMQLYLTWNNKWSTF